MEALASNVIGSPTYPWPEPVIAACGGTCGGWVGSSVGVGCGGCVGPTVGVGCDGWVGTNVAVGAGGWVGPAVAVGCGGWVGVAVGATGTVMVIFCVAVLWYPRWSVTVNTTLCVAGLVYT